MYFPINAFGRIQKNSLRSDNTLLVQYNYLDNDTVSIRNSV